AATSRRHRLSRYQGHAARARGCRRGRRPHAARRLLRRRAPSRQGSRIRRRGLGRRTIPHRPIGRPTAHPKGLTHRMAQDLAKKVAFITGASSGIGLATARAFAAQGARLLLAARRKEPLEAERATLTGAAEIHTLQLDVPDHAAVERAIAALPGAWQAIDILVNNAG